MYKQTVTYTDFNGVEKTEDLYFHISKDQAMEQSVEDMGERLQALQTEIGTEPRDLETFEIRKILNIVKELIDMSYGEKSEDGRLFRKSAEISADFRNSAMYSNFLLGLFQPAENAMKFIQAIFPKDIMDEVNKAIAEEKSSGEVTTGGEMKAVEAEVPAYIRENRDPTKAELRNMTPDELRDAYIRKSEQV